MNNKNILYILGGIFCLISSVVIYLPSISTAKTLGDALWHVQNAMAIGTGGEADFFYHGTLLFLALFIWYGVLALAGIMFGKWDGVNGFVEFVTLNDLTTLVWGRILFLIIFLGAVLLVSLYLRRAGAKKITSFVVLMLTALAAGPLFYTNEIKNETLVFLFAAVIFLWCDRTISSAWYQISLGALAALVFNLYFTAWGYLLPIGFRLVEETMNNKVSGNWSVKAYFSVLRRPWLFFVHPVFLRFLLGFIIILLLTNPWLIIKPVQVMQLLVGYRLDFLLFEDHSLFSRGSTGFNGFIKGLAFAFPGGIVTTVLVLFWSLMRLNRRRFIALSVLLPYLVVLLISNAKLERMFLVTTMPIAVLFGLALADWTHHNARSWVKLLSWVLVFALLAINAYDVRSWKKHYNYVSPIPAVEKWFYENVPEGSTVLAWEENGTLSTPLLANGTEESYKRKKEISLWYGESGRRTQVFAKNRRPPAYNLYYIEWPLASPRGLKTRSFPDNSKFIEDVGLDYITMPENEFKRWSNLDNEHFPQPIAFMHAMKRTFTRIAIVPENNKSSVRWFIWKRTSDS